MKTIILATLISLSAFGQGKFLNTPTGVMDASGLQMIFPQKTVATLGSAATAGVGTRYTVTDCLNYNCTTGGGPFRVDMVSTGSVWLTANNVLIFGITDVMLGAKNDCQPGIGTPGANICGVGITPTDDTAVLQAYLSTASASNPVHLVKTGPSYFTHLEIVQAGYTTISGVGPQSGFWQKPGSNADGIGTVGVTNSFTAPNDNPSCGNNTVNVTSPGTAPARGQFVFLRNFTLNGNRGTFNSGTNNYNRDGNATGVCYQGTTVYTFNFNLISFNYVTLENILSLDAPSWNFKLENVGYVNARGITSRETYGTTGTTVRHYNGDGFDILGPANDIHVSDITVTNSGDDGIALNCGNGWTGDILRVTIDGYISNDNTSFVRMISYYSTTVKGHINDVAVNNMVGNSTESGITIGFLGSAPTTVADWMQRLYLNNVHMKSPSFIAISAEPQGEIQINNTTWSPVTPVAASPCTSAPCPAVILRDAVAGKTQAALIAFNGFTIYRETGAASSGYFLQVNNGATVVRATFGDVKVVNELSGGTAAIANAIDIPSGGAITTVEVGAINPTLITALGTSGTLSRIGTLKGMDRADTSFLLGTPSVATCGTIGTGSTNMAGFITSATTGSCVSVLTFVGKTATTGWSCGISDATTANLISQTGSSTTTATFTGTTVSGDVLRYTCNPY